MSAGASQRYAELKAALLGQALPVALVDLDALEANVDVLAKKAKNKPIRVASKSIRSPELLRRIFAQAGGKAEGVLAYSAEEAELLVGEGFTDLLLAYPLAQPSEAALIARLNAEGAKVRPVADAPFHLELLAAAAKAARVTIPVVIDVDVSYRPIGSLHLGARRSPLHSAADVAAFASRLASYASLTFEGIQAYDAHIAGLPDSSLFATALNGPKRLFKRLAEPAAFAQRAEIKRELQLRGLSVNVFDGGGTGSLESSSDDPSLTEIAAGSGFLDGHLFDGYAGLTLTPAAFFALPVTRLPAPGFATCQGGGFIASGAAGKDRLPLPWLPARLALLPGEGAGEVQTPLAVPPEVTLAIGDPVFFRHAKSGELAERFNEYLLVRRGRVEGRAPTYRGLGRAFH